MLSNVRGFEEESVARTTASRVRGTSVATSVLTVVRQGDRGPRVRTADRKGGGPRYLLDDSRLEIDNNRRRTLATFCRAARSSRSQGKNLLCARLTDGAKGGFGFAADNR